MARSTRSSAQPSSSNAVAKSASEQPPQAQAAIQYYLIAYNVVSTLLWTYIFSLTAYHLAFGVLPAPVAAPAAATPGTVQKLFGSLPFLSAPPAAPIKAASKAPGILYPLYVRAATLFTTVGMQVKTIQTLALLEVLHSATGIVKSPLSSTVMQVASRLYIVWGIVDQFQEAQSNPVYASMVLSWAMTEMVRYSFYAADRLSYKFDTLTYLRYTMFYVLYPTGAGSEAFLIFSTLPLAYPPSVAAIMKTWSAADYARAVTLLAWPPSLYNLYTYMIAQREKVMGSADPRKTK